MADRGSARMMRAPAHSAASHGWQPIETAPKGESVLVGTTDPLGNMGCPVVLARQHADGGWNHTGAAWTHWMPIPERPEASDNPWQRGYAKWARHAQWERLSRMLRVHAPAAQAAEQK